jgi:hypothetical protein
MGRGMGMILGIEIKLIVPLHKGDLGGSSPGNDRSFSVGAIDPSQSDNAATKQLLIRSISFPSKPQPNKHSKIQVDLRSTQPNDWPTT